MEIGMTLLDVFLRITKPWYLTFSQMRSFNRAIRLSLSIFTTLGRKTISRTIATSGRDQLDWSADYRFFSRCTWSPCQLFRPILKEAIELVDEDYITVGYDDTLVKKTGKKIKGAGWARDPLGPPFTTNFVWGMRYLQSSILLPLYNEKGGSCRGIPVQFEQLPKFKKPRWNAPQEQHDKYQELIKTYNSSTTFVKNLRYLRNELDQAGAKDKLLIAAVDGSYCNQTCLTANIDRTTIIGRTRKNARLFFRDYNPPKPKRGKTRFYHPDSFTPEEIRQDDQVTYENMQIHYGGNWRDIRYKEVHDVYWKYGTKTLSLRLIIIAPTRYKKTKNQKKWYYRDPAYLLTPDHETSTEVLIQKYFDRWQIEVNFQEEKRDLGLGQAQVWSEKSIPKAPAFLVASYSAMILASVIVYGCNRNNDFQLLPKWRKNSIRPSCLDVLTRLRFEIDNSPEKVVPFGLKTSTSRMVLKSAA